MVKTRRSHARARLAAGDRRPARAGALALGLLAMLTACAPQGVEGPATPGTSSDAILGGSVDRNDPAVVAILGETSDGIFVCTGTLIAPNLVLTAHHCVANVGNGQTISCTDTFATPFAVSSFLVTGSYNAAANAFNNGVQPRVDGVTWFSVRTVHVPPGNNSACGADIAMLELSSNVANVCPAIPRVDTAPVVGESFAAVGFGVTSATAQAAGTRFRADGLSVFAARQCGGDLDTSLEWCGGERRGTKGTCEGDSGGPAIDSAGRVLGTVSRGPGDCSVTVYTGVNGWRSWINATMQTAAGHGRFSVPAWVSGASTANPSSGFCADGGGVAVSDAGTTTADGGAIGGACPSPLECTDGSGQGDFGCFDAGTSDGFPAGAPTCRANNDCAAGFDCWAASQGATTGNCIQSCSGGGAVDAGTPPPRDGGTASAGSCGGGLSCLDGSGQGDFACFDPNAPNGFPANAPTCRSNGDCAADSDCWSASANATTGSCIQVCTNVNPTDAGPSPGEDGGSMNPLSDGGAMDVDGGRAERSGDAGAASSGDGGGGSGPRAGCVAADGAPSLGSLLLMAVALGLRRRRSSTRKNAAARGATR